MWNSGWCSQGCVSCASFRSCCANSAGGSIVGLLPGSSIESTPIPEQVKHLKKQMIYTEKRRSRVPVERKTLLCFFLLMVSTPNAWGTPQAADEISTPDQFKDEFQTVPCKNSERQDAVKILFEQMGAAASEITVDSYKQVENVLIRRDGTGDGLIVVGAHYDKTNNGCGALDNWTGIVAMAHIYRSLKRAPIQKTVLFVAFGDEERGLVGSRAMV